jgi:pyruvate dehydrogenase E2 component (dihydrolipoamide acetyltransferase)
MAETVLMPKQGNSVESCIILEWKKQEGDSVALGEVLCEVETDKATIEVESTAEGTVLKLLYAAEDDVPVQVPIVVVGTAGEDISGLISEAGGKTGSSGDKVQKEEPAPAANEQEKKAAESLKAQDQPLSAARTSGTSFVSPRAGNRAEKLGISAEHLIGSGPKKRVIERDVLKAAEGQQPITPAAREKLKSGKLHTPASGSGIGGRVLSADLSSGTAAQTPGFAASAEAGPEFPGAFREIPVRSIRKITAKRMHESLAVTAQLTMHASADARQLQSLRKRLKSSDPALGLSGVTINDLVLFAAAKTLRQFPAVNAHFLGESIREFEHVHLGFAVDTPKGLMVPVIRNADLLTLRELSIRTKTLTEKCQTGKAASEDLEGGTATVTNLGALGIEAFTPVLNIPQTAILGICSIELKPVQGAREVEFIPHIGISMTFDHQAVDGAPAARFLKTLTDNIKDIDLLLAL